MSYNLEAAGLTAVGGFLASKVYEDLFHPTIKLFGKKISEKIAVALFNESKDYTQEILSKKLSLLLNDISERLSNNLVEIDINEITDNAPKYIILPAINAWEYSIDAPELRNLYANLITSSILNKYSNKVHPAFIEVIKQLHPMEVIIQQELMQTSIHPVVNIKVHKKLNSRVLIGGRPIDDIIGKSEPAKILFKNLTFMKCSSDPVEISFHLSNLQRLGLIDLNFNFSDLDNQDYEKILNLEFVKKFSDEHNEKSLVSDKERQINFDRGTITFTVFGESFNRICMSL